MIHMLRTLNRIITRQKQRDYAVFRSIKLSKNGKRRKEWTLVAKRLKGQVGYGITTFTNKLPVDVKNRRKFNENIIMVRNDSGFINGGKSDKMQHSGIQWKMGDKITCYFDQRKGFFSMRKNGEKWVTIEKEVRSGKIFYPFIRFSGPTEAAEGDQIEFMYSDPLIILNYTY